MKKMTARDLQKMINEELTILQTKAPAGKKKLNEGLALAIVPMIGGAAGSWLGSKFSEFPELEADLDAIGQDLNQVHKDLGIQAGRMITALAAIKITQRKGDITQTAGFDAITEGAIFPSGTGEVFLTAELLNQVIKEEHAEFTRRLIATKKKNQGSKSNINEIAPLLGLGLLALAAGTATAVGTALGDEGAEAKLKRAIKMAENFTNDFIRIHDEMMNINDEFKDYIEQGSPGAYEQLVVAISPTLGSEPGGGAQDMAESVLDMANLTSMIMEEWNSLNEEQEVLNEILGDDLFAVYPDNHPQHAGKPMPLKGMDPAKIKSMHASGDLKLMQMTGKGANQMTYHAVDTTGAKIGQQITVKNPAAGLSGQAAKDAIRGTQWQSVNKAQSLRSGMAHGGHIGGGAFNRTAWFAGGGGGAAGGAAGGAGGAAGGAGAAGRGAAFKAGLSKAWWGKGGKAAFMGTAGVKHAFLLNPAGATGVLGRVGSFLGSGPFAVALGGIIAYATAPDESERERAATEAETQTQRILKDLQADLKVYERGWKEHKKKNGKLGAQRMRQALQILGSE